MWDMLEFDAHKFVGLMNSLRSITLMNRTRTPEQKAADTKGAREALGAMLQEHADHLAEMRLPTSKAAILDLKSSVVSYGPYNDLADEKVGFACRILRMETEGRKFLQIEDEDLYREGADLFGRDVATKFATDGVFEIDEAGKCLAVGRYTAAVFHLMRIMEVGVKAASACLGIPDPVRGGDRNWGNMLRRFKSEMDRRNAVRPPEWQIATDRDFFEEIYVSLDAVRNVWRNATMHVENKYTPEEAEHIFGAVRGFMRKLASRLDEKGQPAA